MFDKTVKATIGAKGIWLRRKGVFDLDRLYSEVKAWLDEMGYEMQEKEHTEKDKPAGKEIKYIFKCEREVTNYYKYYIDITFFILNAIPMSGNLISANARIAIEAHVELDRLKKWQNKGKFVDFLFKIYNNYIIKKEVEKYRDQLYEEVLELQDLIKDVMDFNR